MRNFRCDHQTALRELVFGITHLLLAEYDDLPENRFYPNVVAKHRLAVLQHLVPAHGSKCGYLRRVS